MLFIDFDTVELMSVYSFQQSTLMLVLGQLRLQILVLLLLMELTVWLCRTTKAYQPACNPQCMVTIWSRKVKSSLPLLLQLQPASQAVTALHQKALTI